MALEHTPETKDILALAVEIGECMLRNGAEIFRIEDSVNRIMSAFSIKRFDVYVLSNGIFASANEDLPDACSMVRHVSQTSVNLSRIAKLNQLSRDICDHTLNLDQAWDCLESIDNSPTYSNWMMVLACGIGSGCFSYLFGGNALDGIFGFLVGAIEELLIIGMGKAKISRFLTQLFAAMAVTILSYLPLTLLPQMVHQDKIIIGAIMVLVPGITFTTSIRDFYRGDYLSGTIHLIDALLTALCIAVGVVIVFAFVKATGLGVIA